MVDLKHEVILYALQDCSEGDVFFLDCPQSIRLWNAFRMKDSLGGRATDKDATQIKVGPNLQAAMSSAAAAYRAAPIVQDHLNEISEGSKDAYCALDDFLIEDKPTATSFANFTSWKAEIAKMVHR
jgi:hypothetical protein